jgi:pimeloyl-ACP methyl ester carboxylesterase
MPGANWFEMESGRLFYRDLGAGPCVVLLHGFAEDGSIWQKQINALKEHCRLIVPDLPGSGRSASWMPVGKNGEAMTLEDHATLIYQVLVSEGIDQCTLIGHSMGGYIALALAEKYPNNLSGLGLFHSTAYADSEEKKNMRIKSIEFIRQHGTAAFIRMTAANLFCEQTRSQRPALVEELIGAYDNFNEGALVSYYEAMMRRPDRTSVLKSFSRPILFMIGEKDPAVPLEQSLRQSHIPAFCYIHILENAGHMGMWESTGEANNFLTAFIKQVAA